MHKKKIYEKYFKRFLDLTISLVAIIILLPILIFTALLIKIMLGSPVIFKQSRPGLNEKIFNLYKFRTMTNEKDNNGILLPDEVRLTRLGRLLRSTSLDELPSLINIIKGDLSIVGPRPLLVKYLPLYNNEQKKRHDVRPGLTGLAQVNGRNSLTWGEKFKYDIKYINNISLINDVRIIMLTIKKVLTREGVSSGNSVTMLEFKGDLDE